MAVLIQENRQKLIYFKQNFNEVPYTVFIMTPKTTKSRLDRLLLLSFASLRLSKQLLHGISFSVRTKDVEFEIAFAILQFCIRALRTFMTVQVDCRHQIEAGQS